MSERPKTRKGTRYPSSGSLVETLDGTRSVQKLDTKTARKRHEMEDQFATAEGRCVQLQQKIDLIKDLKARRSRRNPTLTDITRVPIQRQNTDIIRRDHRNQTYEEAGEEMHQPSNKKVIDLTMKLRRQAYGDSNADELRQNAKGSRILHYNTTRRNTLGYQTGKQISSGTKKKNLGKTETQSMAGVPDERPVVELYRSNETTPRNSKDAQQTYNDHLTGPLDGNGATWKEAWQPTRRKLGRRVHHYEKPTFSSQLKKNSTRYYPINIPFTLAKSTAPSHNIGVNLQKVLNGVKMQEPLSGVPLTIAHHMGLRRLLTEEEAKTTGMAPEMMLDVENINVLRLGQKYMRLPSYKSMSYNRLLTMYREGEGMVPRFLRSLYHPYKECVYYED